MATSPQITTHGTDHVTPGVAWDSEATHCTSLGSVSHFSSLGMQSALGEEATSSNSAHSLWRLSRSLNRSIVSQGPFKITLF